VQAAKALSRGDYATAVEWFQKAAEQGYALAQILLGRMYINGEGVTQNYQEAVKWFQKAAVQGNADAQVYLGIMYGTGKGVTANDQGIMDMLRRKNYYNNWVNNKQVLGAFYWLFQHSLYSSQV